MPLRAAANTTANTTSDKNICGRPGCSNPKKNPKKICEICRKNDEETKNAQKKAAASKKAADKAAAMAAASKKAADKAAAKAAKDAEAAKAASVKSAPAKAKKN